MSLSLAAATGIGAGLQIGGGILNNAFNARQGRAQRRHELDMWNMTNEYNSPAAQMQRLRDAGLNPHLVHGNANQAEQPHQTADDPSINPMESIMPALAQISQIRATNMEIAKKQAEIEHIQGNTRNQDIMRKDYQLRANVAYFDQYIRERQHQLDTQRHSHTVDMSRYQRDLQIAQAERDRARAELFLEQAASSREMTPAQVAQIRQNMRFSSDLHQYNLQSSRARATIDQFHARDRMLELIEREVMSRIENNLEQADRNRQRRVFGVDVHRDNPITYPLRDIRYVPLFYNMIKTRRYR